MYSFIIILDNDDDRRANLMIDARAAMMHFSPADPDAEKSGHGISIATWGKTRLHIQGQSWRLGIGSWLGPAESPSLPMLRDDALDAYDGTYCFLAGDLQSPAIHVATDPVGRMHAFYAQPSPHTWIVSNSSLVLSALTNDGWQLDSVREFLAKGTVFDQRSLFSRVHKFAPGAVHHLRPGGMDTTPLAPLFHPPIHDTHRLVATYSEAITESTSRVFSAYPNPILDLTGGFDSRLLLASMLETRPASEIATVVVGTATDRDVLVASAIARKFGLRHQHIEPVQTRDISDTALWNSALLSDAGFDVLEYAKIMHVHERLSQDFDASINGSGGGIMRDEWLQVFDRPYLPMRPWNSMRLAARRFATDAWAEHIIEPAPQDSLAEHFSRLIDKLIAQQGGEGTQRFVDEALLYMRIQHWQGRISSATHGIWPNYSPFLMRKPLATALSVPSALRRNGLMHRLVLENLNRPLAEMPMCDGSPATPVRMNNLFAHMPRYRKTLSDRIKAVRTRLFGLQTTPRDISPAANLPTAAQSVATSEMLAAPLFKEARFAELIDALGKNKLPIHYAGRLLTLEYAARLKQRISQSSPA